MKNLIIFSIVILAVSCNESKKDMPAAKPGEDTATIKTASNKNEMKAAMDSMMMQMHMIKPTGDNDADYAAMMLSHHSGAVEMAKKEVAHGTDTAIISFANKVMAAQNKEMVMMMDYLRDHDTKQSANAAEMQAGLNNAMMAMMQAPAPEYNNPDKDFAAQMIPHHQSAVDIAKAYLKLGTDPQLTKLSKDIVSSQSAEIDFLNKWLNE